MRDLSPGWTTDLAVLELSGANIEERGDHLVVRSPRSPDFHWGNCLFVTDPLAVDDAARWVAQFQVEFPEATWISIGLAGTPDPTPWSAFGIEIEVEDVLTTRTMPRQTPLPDGYEARRLEGDDWEQSIASAMVENERTGEYDMVGHERFVRAQVRTRQELSQRDTAAYFGAFAAGVLVADLGIVRCGVTARYQAVGTDEAHRRRGLAAHLLGVAAQWAADNGCDQWVIVTEATNPAGRVYRGAGFQPDIGNARGYRHPPQ